MMLAVAMLKYNPSEGFSAANAGAYFVQVVNSNVTTGVPMLFAPLDALAVANLRSAKGARKSYLRVIN